MLIAPIEDEAKQTKSGIVLPDSADKKKQNKRTVIAMGPRKVKETGEQVPISITIKQVVLFKEPWGDENKIENNDKKYFLVEEDEILAVVE